MTYNIIYQKNEGNIHVMEVKRHDAIDTTVLLALDSREDPAKLLVWSDTGLNCWCNVSNRKFYLDIAREVGLI